MDKFTLAIAIIMIALSLQFEQNLLAAGIIVLMIISLKSWVATIVLIGSLAFLFFTREAIGIYWPYIIVGLVILAFVLDSRAKNPAPDYGGGFGGLGGGL